VRKPDIIDVVVKQVIPFAGQFIDAIHINWIDRMLFIDRQMLGPPVKPGVCWQKRFSRRNYAVGTLPGCEAAPQR